RAGTAFGTVDGDEIRSGLRAPLADLRQQVVQPRGMSDHGLETHGLARLLADVLDDVQQILVALDVEVPVRADGVGAGTDAADRGDLLRDLGPRQDPALAGLGALAELD